jgi:hypothetical protein
VQAQLGAPEPGLVKKPPGRAPVWRPRNLARIAAGVLVVGAVLGAAALGRAAVLRWMSDDGAPAWASMAWAQDPVGLDAGRVQDVWGSAPNEVFVVTSTGAIQRLKDGRWTGTPSENVQPLFGVSGTSPKNVFAVGLTGATLRYDGARWRPLANDRPDAALVDVWAASQDEAFAVGSNGVILHFADARWTTVWNDSTRRLWGVWGASPSDVFAVGDGVIMHYDGRTWTNVLDSPSLQTAALRAVWGSSGADVYAVGLDGMILHLRDSKWRSVHNEPGRKLRSVWGTSSRDVWAVGHETLMHFDGREWVELDAGKGRDLLAVWATPGNVFAVGANGLVLHGTVGAKK